MFCRTVKFFLFSQHMEVLFVCCLSYSKLGSLVAHLLAENKQPGRGGKVGVPEMGLFN